jgi:hypothetical protein
VSRGRSTQQGGPALPCAVAALAHALGEGLRVGGQAGGVPPVVAGELGGRLDQITLVTGPDRGPAGHGPREAAAPAAAPYLGAQGPGHEPGAASWACRGLRAACREEWGWPGVVSPSKSLPTEREEPLPARRHSHRLCRAGEHAPRQSGRTACCRCRGPATWGDPRLARGKEEQCVRKSKAQGFVEHGATTVVETYHTTGWRTRRRGPLCGVPPRRC